MSQSGIVSLAVENKGLQLLRDHLDLIRLQYKPKKLPLVHVLGDLTTYIAWPVRLNVNGSVVRQSEGQMLIDRIKD